MENAGGDDPRRRRRERKIRELRGLSAERSRPPNTVRVTPDSSSSSSLEEPSIAPVTTATLGSPLQALSEEPVIRAPCRSKSENDTPLRDSGIRRRIRAIGRCIATPRENASARPLHSASSDEEKDSDDRHTPPPLEGNYDRPGAFVARGRAIGNRPAWVRPSSPRSPTRTSPEEQVTARETPSRATPGTMSGRGALRASSSRMALRLQRISTHLPLSIRHMFSAPLAEAEPVNQAHCVVHATNVEPLHPTRHPMLYFGAGLVVGAAAMWLILQPHSSCSGILQDSNEPLVPGESDPSSIVPFVLRALPMGHY